MTIMKFEEYTKKFNDFLLNESVVDDDYDTSNVSRVDLKKLMAKLDELDISYGLDGDIISFDSSELGASDQKELTKIGLKSV